MIIVVICVLVFLVVWIGLASRNIYIIPLSGTQGIGTAVTRAWHGLRGLGYSGYTKDGLRRERLWHFWMRKTATMLFFAIMAGGMCTVAVVVLLVILNWFGLYLAWVPDYPEGAFGVFSLGFFVWWMTTPPHRPPE